MQAILLNDLPNFFSYSSWLSMEFPIQFMGQVFFFLSFCPFSFLFLYLSPAFRPFFEIRLQPFRLNWYFLIKWENLLVFQSISVANDVYSVIIKTHERRGKKSWLAPQWWYRRKKSRETWTWEIFSRCTSLPTNSKEAEWKSIEHVLEMCGAQPLHLDPSTTLPMQFDMIARKFFHVEQPAHHHSFFFGRVSAFFPLFGSFIFIHFVQNLPNKKCSTASILHGACERVSKRDRKRVFGANTTCWCYNWFFFHFHSIGFPFFSFSVAHPLTQEHVQLHIL